MAITNVGMYSKPHGTQGGGGGGTTIYKGSVSGSDLPSDLNVTSITASDGHIDDITGKTLSYNEGSFLYIYSKDGNISKLRGDELKYTKGKIDKFEADEITCNGNITTQDLHSETGWINELNSKYITTDYLTVNKQAHFFELIIDKVRSVGGTLILTQANCVADYVKAVDSNGTYLPNLDDPNAAAYDIFWLARDKNSGRTVDNDWLVNDQAFCTSFNVHEGTNYDISNKYYWRLVTDILGDRYMNIRSGAELPLVQESQASVNSVTINTPTISYVVNGNDNVINTGWNTIAQTVDGIITGVTWTQTSGGAGQQTSGTMTTTNTVFGIQMSPIDGTSLISAVPQKFYFTCTAARLNVGVYYQDGTSEYFPAPDVATTSYEFTLKRVKDEQGPQGPQGNQGPTYHSETNTPIEAVVITNADEVEWQLVHGIRLSNTDKDVPENHPNDQFYDDKYSIPSIGDNIAQLGYRATSSSDPNYKRGNAIIIAAYKTPDGGTGEQGEFNENPIDPPSYAQYESIGTQSGHEFDLAWYRRTFMDANRSVFAGSFYTGSAGNWTDIEDQIQAGAADLFYLYVAYCNDPNEPNPQLYDPTNPTAAYNWCIAPDMPGGVSWGYMGFCSMPIDIQKDPVTGQPTETEQQAIDRVKRSLTFADFGFNEVPGGSGTPGGHWVSCYKNSTEKYNNQISELAPPNDGNVAKRIDELPWHGWYAEPQPLPTPDPQNPEQFTWESQAFVSGSGAYQLWQPAIRITGADGTPGTDGNDIEFIYCQDPGDHDGDPVNIPAPPNGRTYPDDWPRHEDPEHPGQYIDHATVNVDGKDYTWYDNPQGITETIKYEYVAERMKRAGNWTDYSTPRVWSSWGKKGTDGDGYEYIFKTYGDPMPVFPDDNYQSAGDADPRNWNASSGPDIYGRTFDDDDYLGPAAQGWTDNPQDLNATDHKYQFQAQRKKYVHTGETTAEWDSFSKPSLWTQYVPKGSQGDPGSHTEFLYKNATTNPGVGVWSQLPAGANKDYLIDNYQWSTAQTTPDFEHGEYTWQTYATVSGTGSYSSWNYPSRISGDNGKDGEDGDNVEFIYRRFNQEITWADDDLNPNNWPANQNPDYTGETQSSPYSDSSAWTDNPNGVDEDYQFEYVATREYKYQTQGATEKTWGKFGVPVIWSKWGERGKDGDGFEYVYKLIGPQGPQGPQGIQAPPLPYNWDVANSEYQTNDEYADGLDGWTDDPQGVSVENPYEMVSVRKRQYYGTIDGTTYNRVMWGKYSDPALWSQYVPKGSQGDAGSHTEFLYKNATTNPGVGVWSQLPAGANKDYLIDNYQWSTAQTTPDFEHGEYTWQTYATVSGTGEYEGWNYPSRISGDNGKDGEDGDSTEFIYRRFKDEITWTNNDLNPNNWPANQTPDYIGKAYQTSESDSPNNKWTDNPRGVTDVYKYEYVATREYKYQIQGATEKTWGQFGVPAIWSKWGERGKDGDGYEYIYKCFPESRLTSEYNTLKNAFNGSASSAYQTNDEYYNQVGWHDDPQTPTQGNPCWVSVRKKQYYGTIDYTTYNRVMWGKYSEPAKWAQYVPQGAQGPAGPQGSTGTNGSGYKLVLDNNTYAQYGMSLNSTNDVVTNLYINIYCRVGKYTDESTSFLTSYDLNGEGLWPYVRLAPYHGNDGRAIWFKMEPYGYGDNRLYKFETTNVNDILRDYGESRYKPTPAEDFANNNKLIQIALIPSTSDKLYESDYNDKQYILQMKDCIEFPLNITSNAQLNAYTDIGGNKSSIAGLVTNMDEQTEVIAQIRADVNGISETVDRINDDYASKSYVEQNGELVSIGVKSDISGELKDTGIDIENDLITLRSNKVKFANNTGTVSDKIWIDPTYGTLHAVNGNFSGTVYASDGTFSGKVYASDGEFTGTVNATSGSFTGTVDANLLYTKVKYLSSTDGMSHSGNIYSYTIDMNDPYNTYIIHMGWVGEYVVNLPSPESYIGLEFEFFAPIIGPTIPPNGNPRLMSSSQNIRYELVGDTQIVDGIGRGGGFISNTNNLILPFNKFVRVKAMKIYRDIGWWVTTGDKWIRLTSDGEPVPTKDTWIKPS